MPFCEGRGELSILSVIIGSANNNLRLLCSNCLSVQEHNLLCISTSTLSGLGFHVPSERVSAPSQGDGSHGQEVSSSKISPTVLS